MVECLEMNACFCLVMRLAVSRAEDMASLIIYSIILHVVHVKDIGLQFAGEVKSPFLNMGVI